MTVALSWLLVVVVLLLAAIAIFAAAVLICSIRNPHDCRARGPEAIAPTRKER